MIQYTSFLTKTGIVFGYGKETMIQFIVFTRDVIYCSLYIGLSYVTHIWYLPVLHYHKIMVIYLYPFLVVITQLFSWIIFINDCICILTGSPG